MRNRLKKHLDSHKEVTGKMESLLTTAENEDRVFTDEEQTSFDELKIKAAELKVQIDNEQAYLDSNIKIPTVPDNNMDTPNEAADRTGQKPVIKMPAVPRSRYPLQCFKGEGGDQRAFDFGMFLLGAMGNPKAAQYCADKGHPMRFVPMSKVDIGALYQEGVNAQGGFLVWPELDTDIIRLVTEYGVFRRNARISPMTSEQKIRNRRTGGLTAYFVGEGDAGTESTGTWDQVQLIAKKLMVLSRFTEEWSADTIISEADNFAVEAALALATKEDQCGFTGDGTSTYGGIVGVNQKLVDINGVDNGGGLILGAGNLMSEITLANHNDVVAILPAYAERDAKWYCSKFYFGSVMQKLAAAAGGNTWEMLASGVRRRIFLGYPVEFSEVFPISDSNSQILTAFGSLRLSSDFGDRAGMLIATSNAASIGGQSTFERAEIAIRAINRFDINNHDLGTATAAGPVVGLISAAS